MQTEFKILYRENKIAIVRHHVKDLCVVAAVPIKKDEEIGICPVSLMKIGDIKKTSKLDMYPMYWTKSMDCIAFGFINLLSHSESSNVYLKRDRKNKLIYAYALKDIEKGHELTIHYECELWFSPIESIVVNL